MVEERGGKVGGSNGRCQKRYTFPDVRLFILTTLILCPGVVVKCHTQSFRPGYESGWLGLLILPCGAEISCLQPPSLQSCLFSCNVNPLLHVHSYEPGVFRHSCWQPPLFDAHSSMSATENTETDGQINYPETGMNRSATATI